MTHYDIVIIGGGSAGSVLANRLSANPDRRVGLLEAGFDPKDPDIEKPEMWPFIRERDYDWAFETEPQPGTANRVHPWTRGKIIGGSSCLHAMAHVRGHRDDFAAWAQATGSDRWSFDGLLPGFKRTEAFSKGASELRGGDGPLPVYLPDAEVNPVVKAYMAAGNLLGVPKISDHNGHNMIGTTPNSLTIRDGKRVSAADAYLTPVRGRKNLTVETGVDVLKLIIDRGKVTGLQVKRRGEAVVITADRYILAAGSISTPLLLMRSGIGDPEVLSKAGVQCLLSSPEIGRNLHDHLLGAGNVYETKQPVPPTKLQHSESLMYLKAGDWTASEGSPDIVLGCVTGPTISEMFDPVAPGHVFTMLWGVCHPTSRGFLAITGPDLSDRPIIDPRYLQTEHDRQKFRAALTAAREVGRQAALSDWRLNEILPGPDVKTEAEIDAFIAKAVITHHHPVGTCRMGSDDRAVVNADLAFNGLDNLSIVDSSVIPKITAGPVHAATLAIAETFAALV